LDRNKALFGQVGQSLILNERYFLVLTRGQPVPKLLSMWLLG